MECTKPAKIIFDTDIGGDCDDAGALGMLHRLCDKGEAELLAVTACYASPYVAGCIDAINRYYGRTVPVGINYESQVSEQGVYSCALCTEFDNAYPPASYEAKSIPDTLAVLRSTLAAAEDYSVTLVATGSMASLARLVQSGPDAYSALSGAELIRTKVCRTVVMGGRFYETWPMAILAGKDQIVTWEWNIKSDIGAAQILCAQWPGELVFSSFEIGNYCISMQTFTRDADPNNPVRRAYELHPSGRTGRESWDHTAMLEAVRPDTYWYYHPYGRVSVNDEGITSWHPDPQGKHTYLIPKVDYEDIRAEIDAILGESCT